MFCLEVRKIWDKSRMLLPQLYKVLQDTNTTDELMLLIPAISSTLSRASSSNVHFTTEVIFLPIASRGFSELDHSKISFIPLLNNRTIKVLLQLIVLSPHIVLSRSASIKVGLHQSNALNLHYVICSLEISLYFSAIIKPVSISMYSLTSFMTLSNQCRN